MSFVYNPPVQTTEITEVKIPFTMFSHQNTLNLDVLKSYYQIELSLSSLDGKLAWNANSVESNNVFTPNLSDGIYVYQY